MPHNAPLIRPLLKTDSEQWAVLWAGYLKYYKTDLSDDITNLTWSRLLDPNFAINGLCAVEIKDDGSQTLMGFVHYLFHPVTWSKSERCYLEDLFTAKSARGKGVGHALISAVNQAAQNHGADQVYWLTEDDNIRAHRLYDDVATRSPFIKYYQPL